MKTGIIIQARKGSTRLPNKMVLPFNKGKGLLELLIEKLKKEFSEEQIILATTTNALDDELESIAEKCSIKSYRGSEDNVLNRFIESAENFEFSNIIRICADNPFLDIPHIHNLIEKIEKGIWDYVSYQTEYNLPTIKSHLGLYTEAVTLKALKKVESNTKLLLYLEHVTNYIYENSDKFNIKLLKLPLYMKHTDSIRLTLDTLEDFEFEKELFSDNSYLSTEELIHNIKSDYRLINKMKIQINKNTK